MNNYSTLPYPASLSLELLCGSDEVDPEHAGYLPVAIEKQNLIQELLAPAGIEVRVQSTFDHGSEFSDAYVYFEPEQMPLVIAAIREAEYEGDILDVNVGILDPETEALAIAEGWTVES